MMKNIWFRANC